MSLPQAPTPFNKLSSNKEEFNLETIKDIHEFNLRFNDLSFIIKLGLNMPKNYFFISSTLNKEFSIIEYNKLFFLVDLINKNKQFKIYENIKEVYNLMIELFEKEKITIKEYKENELIKLEIKLSSLSGDEQIVDVDIFKTEINKDRIIEQLIAKVISLQAEIQEIKKDNQRRDKEIESLKKVINEIRSNKKNNIINENDIKINNNESVEVKKLYNYFINSRIVTQKEIEFLVNELKNIYNTSNEKKIFKAKLLFRASRDNFEAKIFHSKCDNITGTLILIENNKGIKFGGFTMETWNGSYVAKLDKYAFCFSISLKKIYPLIKDKEAIRCDPKKGPIFLNDIFGFRKENIKFGECFTKEHCNFSGANINYEINGAEKDLEANEIEVFHITFE